MTERLAFIVFVLVSSLLQNPIVIIVAGLTLAVVILVTALFLFRNSGKKKGAKANKQSGTPDWQRQGQQAWNQPGMGGPSDNWGQQQQQPGAWGGQAPSQQPQLGAWGGQTGQRLGSTDTFAAAPTGGVGRANTLTTAPTGSVGQPNPQYALSRCRFRGRPTRVGCDFYASTISSTGTGPMGAAPTSGGSITAGSLGMGRRYAK